LDPSNALIEQLGTVVVLIVVIMVVCSLAVSFSLPVEFAMFKFGDGWSFSCAVLSGD
jgi:uncharacterized membrane protein YdbT with pleckstrin-like domain